MNKSQQDFLNYIKNGEKVAFLVAPSFAANYSYPEIVCMLRDLGADMVTEITYGSFLINQHYNHYIEAHRDQKYFINTTCPTIVNFIKTKYPDLEKYLFPHISCVMAFINLFNTLYPDHKTVFISPCVAKRNIELPLMYEWNLVLTYQDLQGLFDSKNIKEEDYKDCDGKWDSFTRIDTKLYPIEGGLALTARWEERYPEKKVIAMSGFKNLLPLFQKMMKGELEDSFLDITACEGSCINGPMMLDKGLSVEEKKQKIIDYYKKFRNSETECSS